MRPESPPEQRNRLVFNHVLTEHLDESRASIVPSVVPATPAELATGFYDARVAGTKPDADLQQALTKLLGRQPYSGYRTSLAVALVNLSGSNRFAPTYAGFNETANFRAASVGKIAGLLAAYQFAADANDFLSKGENTGIGDVETLERALKKLWSQQGIPETDHPLVRSVLVFQAGPPRTVILNPELIKRFDDITHGNVNGSTAIVLLKCPFIGSTMLDYGLFSPVNKGGLWVRKTYAEVRYLGKTLNIPEWTKERGNPYPDFSCNIVNAVAAAQFYTLAAQGRMVNRTTSQAILGHLDWDKGGCVTIDLDPAFGDSGFIAAKCGIYDDGGVDGIRGCGGAKQRGEPAVLHDTIYFKAAASRREFVVIMLTRNRVPDNVRSRLFRDLTALMP